MFGEKLVIKKYPYLGHSPNLIEYFGIIGFSENFIPELLSSLKSTNTNPQSQTKNISPYSPTVLSSLTSKDDYGIVDNDLIINQLYPENPKIFNWEPNQPEPEKSSVIYSFCFDSQDGQEKIFYTCFGYKFYELYKNKKNEEEETEETENEEQYYLPKAFCIISQYSFFNAFYNICTNLYDILVNKKNIIPFEILLYNIINYIPSPINNKLDLYLFPNEKEDLKIEINQLTGFPNVDFDLYEIFNLLPLNLVLEIYTITFIEEYMLFFSSNLELLNIIMYIMYMFNYPCNDSTYFWHIVSVGKNDLKEENKFVGKIMPSLLGVNCTFDPSIDTSAFANYHFVIDLDNKKIIYKESVNIFIEDKEESNKLNNLYYYIDNIFREKNVDSNVIKKPLLKLKNRIENLLYEKIPGFTTNPKKNFVNFFKTEKNPKIQNINIKILEFFYDCNLTLLTNFYHDNQLNSSFDKIEKQEKIILFLNGSDKQLNNINITEDEEKYFLEQFRNSVKYKIYFENFMTEFGVMDVFRIPFFFSRIFIELKLRDEEEISCEKIEYFNLINQFYRLNNTQSFHRKINFESFNQHYNENMSQYFKRFFENDYDNSIFGQNAKEEMGKTDVPKEQKLQLINMNKKIINRYIYIMQNFYENQDIENLFPHTRKKDIKIIKVADRRVIYQLIKNKLIEKKYFSSLNFLIYTLTYVVSLTITLHPFEQMISYLAEIQEALKLIKYFMPHYIYTLIKSIYKYYLINKETSKYPTMSLTHIKMYFYFLANFIRSQYIVPNEEIMYILGGFFSDLIFQERKEINIIDEQKKTKTKEESSVSEGKKEFVDVYKNKSYLLYMRYCFNSKKMFSAKTMVERAMEELECSNVIISLGNKTNHPQVAIKIKEYYHESRFFTPRKLFRDSENIFEDLFDNYNLDNSFLNINKLREIILNLMIYGTELPETKLPVGYLMNTLYFLRKFEETKKESKIEKI